MKISIEFMEYEKEAATEKYYQRNNDCSGTGIRKIIYINKGFNG